jgi:predicted enzyme related to lactoylglutathione lyase
MPSTIQAILHTDNLVRAQRFYEEVFDAKATQRVPEEGDVFFQSLLIGDSDLGLVREDAEFKDRPGRILLSIMVEDADAVLSLVEAAGGTVTGPPNDMPWGQRVAHVLDPDGNMINVTQDLDGAP